MKKFALILLTLLSVTAFSGCGKEEKETLVDTIWMKVEDGVAIVLSFKDTTCTMTIGNSYVNVYDYTYNPPNVTLTPYDNGLAIQRGTVADGVMTLTNVSTGMQFVYIKQ